MKRKGISPLIAAVLLIAFTMAVASLFAQWAPQLIEDAQGDTRNQSAELQRCSSITLDVISGDVNSTTFQQQTGEDAVGDVSVTWFYQDSDPIQDSIRLNSSRQAVTLEHGQSATGNGARVLDEIRLQPTACEGAAATSYEP